MSDRPRIILDEADFDKGQVHVAPADELPPPTTAAVPLSPQPRTDEAPDSRLAGLALVAAIVAAIVAWFAENAAIHAMGYSGFGGAGWITAVVIPLGTTRWVWGKCMEYRDR